MLNELADGTWFEFESNKQRSSPFFFFFYTEQGQFFDTYFWQEGQILTHDQQQQLSPIYTR